MEYAKIDLQKQLTLVLVVGNEAHVMEAQPINVSYEDCFTLNIKFNVPNSPRIEKIKPLLSPAQYRKDLSTASDLLERVLEVHKQALAELEVMCEAKQLLGKQERG